MNRLLQSALFYTAYFLFSLVYIPSGALVALAMAPFVSVRQTMRTIRWFIRGYGVMTVWLGYPWVRFRMENRSGLPPGAPCLFVSNHQSIGDIYLMASLPYEVVFISNAWPFKIPVLGFFAKLAGYINTFTTDPAEFQQLASKFFAEGVSIVCFPEGTRTPDGQLGPFHSAGFRLALQSHVPVVPICISGSHRIMPKGRALLSPGEIRMSLLPALSPQSIETLTHHQLRKMTRASIAEELAVLQGGAA